MHALVHAADVQDRDGGALVMATLFGSFPFLLKLYADGGYQGPEFRQAVGKVIAGVNIEIVKRPVRSGERLRRSPTQMGRRTHLRVARAMPPTGQGLGMSVTQSARLPAPRFHSPHATKTL